MRKKISNCEQKSVAMLSLCWSLKWEVWVQVLDGSWVGDTINSHSASPQPDVAPANCQEILRKFRGEGVEYLRFISIQFRGLAEGGGVGEGG